MRKVIQQRGSIQIKLKITNSYFCKRNFPEIQSRASTLIFAIRRKILIRIIKILSLIQSFKDSEFNSYVIFRITRFSLRDTSREKCEP